MITDLRARHAGLGCPGGRDRLRRRGWATTVTGTDQGMTFPPTPDPGPVDPPPTPVDPVPSEPAPEPSPVPSPTDPIAPPPS